jgi:hypothetical protein
MSEEQLKTYIDKAAKLERTAKSQLNPIYVTVYEKLAFAYRTLAEQEQMDHREPTELNS